MSWNTSCLAKFTGLRTLRLIGGIKIDDGLPELLRGCKNLRELELSSFHFSSEVVSALVEHRELEAVRVNSLSHSTFRFFAHPDSTTVLPMSKLRLHINREEYAPYFLCRFLRSYGHIFAEVHIDHLNTSCYPYQPLESRTEFVGFQQQRRLMINTSYIKVDKNTEPNFLSDCLLVVTSVKGTSN
jgi:hypothetical protein